MQMVSYFKGTFVEFYLNNMFCARAGDVLLLQGLPALPAGPGGPRRRAARHRGHDQAL